MDDCKEYIIHETEHVTFKFVDSNISLPFYWLQGSDCDLEIYVKNGIVKHFGLTMDAYEGFHKEIKSKKTDEEFFKLIFEAMTIHNKEMNELNL